MATKLEPSKQECARRQTSSSESRPHDGYQNLTLGGRQVALPLASSSSSSRSALTGRDGDQQFKSSDCASVSSKSSKLSSNFGNLFLKSSILFYEDYSDSFDLLEYLTKNIMFHKFTVAFHQQTMKKDKLDAISGDIVELQVMVEPMEDKKKIEQEKHKFMIQGLYVNDAPGDANDDEEKEAQKELLPPLKYWAKDHNKKDIMFHKFTVAFHQQTMKKDKLDALSGDTVELQVMVEPMEDEKKIEQEKRKFMIQALNATDGDGNDNKVQCRHCSVWVHGDAMPSHVGRNDHVGFNGQEKQRFLSAILKNKQIKNYPELNTSTAVFMDIRFPDNSQGRIVIDLLNDTVPVTAAVFRNLCSGLFNESYIGTSFTYFTQDAICFVGGDITPVQHNRAFPVAAENYNVRHNVDGVVGVANAGTTQFYITNAKAPHLDGQHVAIGSVGFLYMDVVRRMQNFMQPGGVIANGGATIINCGLYM